MSPHPAEIEQLVDRIVQRRLAIDSSYLHAETAEEQAEAEQRITAEVWDLARTGRRRERPAGRPNHQ